MGHISLSSGVGPVCYSQGWPVQLDALKRRFFVNDDILVSPSREQPSVQRMTDTAKIRDVLDVVPDSVIVTERDGSIWFANQAAVHMFGYSADELFGQSVELLVPVALRERHREHRELYDSAPTIRPLGVGLKLTALRRNGEEFPVEISISPVEMADGLRFVSTIRDQTDQRRVEALLGRRTVHLQLLQLTNIVANDAGSSDDALSLAIREVCRHLRFDVGHAFVTQSGDIMYGASLRISWYTASSDHFEEFREVSDKNACTPGVGLTGKVLESGEPIWCPDVQFEPEYLRGASASACGLRTGIFVPVLIGDQVVSVLEFYTKVRLEKDPELLEALVQIGMLLGRTVERKRSREKFLEDAAFRDRVLDASGDGILIVSRDGVIESANLWISNALEEPRSQVVGSSISEVPRYSTEKSFDDFPAAGHPLLGVFERGEPVNNLEMRALRPVQGPIDLSFNITPLFDDSGVVQRAVLSIRDISEQRRAQALLTEQHDVLEAVARGVPLSDVARRIAEHVEHHVSDIRVAMYVASDDQPHSFDLLTAPSIAPSIVQYILTIDTLSSDHPAARAVMRREPVFWLYEDDTALPESIPSDLRSDYEIRAIWSFPVLTNSDRVLGILSIYSDQPRRPLDRDLEVISQATGLAQIAIERDTFERQLARQAFYDELTGLPKRALLMDRIHQAQQRALRSGRDVAVLFVDLDEFKAVNDSLGHQAGDELLKQASIRLSRSVRAEDTVVRFAGDEFVIVLEDITSDDEVDRVVSRIQRSFVDPLPVNDIDVYASCSIGVARNHASNIDAEGLLRRADHAMYRAKEKGRGHAAVFSAEIDEALLSPLELETHLRVAVASEAFHLVYQPVLEIETGEVYAFEALIRWFDEELGDVLPDTFLPVAVELGLMPQITRWVFLTASQQLADWREEFDIDIRLMINISPGELLGTSVLPMVAELIGDVPLPADRIIIELTEQAMIDSSSLAGDTLQQLRHMNVELALDDFGTGYSSLSYLHTFPVSYIKLDRSFLTGLEATKTSPAVISGIVQIAQKLGIRVISEGVESIANERFVHSIGCDYAQGFYYALPQLPQRAPSILRRSSE